MTRILSHFLVSLLCASVIHADEITGKLFRVDPQKRSFELLKETEYDPKTEVGQSRFTVHWTGQSTLRNRTEKPNFAGIKGPVFAEFRGIDEANRKALAARKPFVARVATLFDKAPDPPQPSISDNEVRGWFTPDPGEKPRSGRIELDGQQVAVSLRSQHSRLIHHENITAHDLARGFWQATLTVRRENDRIIADHIDATPLPDPRLTDDPKLPRVLVIGDSISMNYHDAAKAALAGTANYHRNEGNAFASAHGVRNSELWLGDYREHGLHWDVIQFNHGLHDLKQTYDAATDIWGPCAIPLAEYKTNLAKQIAILRKSGAKLIFCTTTPVPNDNKSAYARRKGASGEFNAAALEVIRKHPDILVTDLHAVVDGSPVFDNWRKGIDVHFYQQEEQRLLGEAVASTIRKALEGR